MLRGEDLLGPIESDIARVWLQPALKALDESIGGQTGASSTNCLQPSC
ncbi:hypothetical protein AB0G55_31360 [Streptomyces toyocaensis]|nr:hypothetical protein [Streptomyces toyocaensis]